MLTARGFTLIELMVTVALIAVLTMLGVPAYQDYVANNRVRVTAGDIREGLQLARMEAIRRNDRVSFCLDGASWSVRSGALCTAGETLRGQQEVRRSVSVSPALLSVIYDGRGRTRSATDAELTGAALSRIAVTRSGECDEECLEMTVEYSPGGMVRVCNPALAAGDPQACEGGA